MAEELVLDIKTNIGQATKETNDYKKSLEQVNEEINLQTKFIIAQEKELIKLKAQQDAIPKGGWVAGMDQLNDKIRETTAELNDEKNGLKSLKQEQKEATQEVKKHKEAQKENNKESEDTIGNFRVMGVSLNGVKKGFSKVIPTAKAMFGTIKAGIISTGIGALVIGVMAVIQAFKRSEKGQEKFQILMAAIGAVTSQVLDLFADLGGVIISAFEDPKKALNDFKDFIVENLTNRFNAAIDTIGFLGSAIKKVFSGDFSGAIDDAKSASSSYVDTLTGVEGTIGKVTEATNKLVAETSKEVAVLIAVTKARQKAHHIDRELKVERAKANREINDIRLQAEDREKFNATERIALLRKAQAIEEGITAKEIKSKKILIDAQKLEMQQGLNSIEDKDKLAEMQAELIDLDTKKLRSQRLLQTQITTAINQEKAEKEQAAADAQKIIDDEFDAKIKANDEWNIEQQRSRDANIAADKKAADDIKKIEDAKMSMQVDMANQGLQILASAAGEGTALAKAAAIAQATISGVQGVQNAFTSANANIGATAGTFGAYPVTMAALAGTFAAMNIAKIASGGGGGVTPPSTPPPSVETPAPQMMSGAFDISGGVAPEPLEAYVLTDSMTNSQNQLANIRRRATI